MKSAAQPKTLTNGRRMDPAQDLFTAIATASAAGAVYGLAAGWMPAKLLDGDAGFRTGGHSAPPARFTLVTRLIEP